MEYGHFSRLKTQVEAFENGVSNCEPRKFRPVLVALYLVLVKVEVIHSWDVAQVSLVNGAVLLWRRDRPM